MDPRRKIHLPRANSKSSHVRSCRGRRNIYNESRRNTSESTCTELWFEMQDFMNITLREALKKESQDWSRCSWMWPILDLYSPRRGQCRAILLFLFLSLTLSSNERSRYTNLWSRGIRIAGYEIAASPGEIMGQITKERGLSHFLSLPTYLYLSRTCLFRTTRGSGGCSRQNSREYAS